MNARFFAAAALLLAAACSDAGGITGPAGVALVRINSSVYLLRAREPAATVSFTVRNTSPGPISLRHCSGGVDTEVQRLDANGWVPWSTNGACPATFDPIPDLVLAPGESAAGKVKVDREGRYRLHTYVRVGESDLFSESAFSAEFEVRSSGF